MFEQMWKSSKDLLVGLPERLGTSASGSKAKSSKCAIPKWTTTLPQNGMSNSGMNCLFNELEGFVSATICGVRPSVANLNSLVEVLRRAQPLDSDRIDCSNHES
jgi:hypothetical protein